MASEVDIINSALNMVGASNIISRSEDSKSARITNQRYDYVRDAVLRAHPWNCAISRVEIAADSDSPAFGFTNQFTLPTDPYCLRVLRLEYLDVDFRVEGRKIHCDEDTVKVIYLARVTDPNEYDQLLVEAIAARLAADTSYALVQSSTLTGTMFQLYEAKLSEARFVDATEGTPGALQSVTVSGTLQADTLVNARL
tara:strand:- start:249 stop:839 length:591 start_codon:yes stop_codon:yes gene_type:complete